MFLPVQPKPLKTCASVSVLPGLMVGLSSLKPAAKADGAPAASIAAASPSEQRVSVVFMFFLLRTRKRAVWPPSCAGHRALSSLAEDAAAAKRLQVEHPHAAVFHRDRAARLQRAQRL